MFIAVITFIPDETLSAVRQSRVKHFNSYVIAGLPFGRVYDGETPATIDICPEAWTSGRLCGVRYSGIHRFLSTRNIRAVRFKIDSVNHHRTGQSLIRG